MPSQISNDLKARIALGHTTLARLWTVVRRDGTAYRFTNHDEPILKVTASPDELFVPENGFLPTAIMSTTGRGIQNADVMVVFGDQSAFPLDGILPGDLAAGLFDGAAFTHEIIDWQYPEYGTLVLMRGEFGPVNWDNKVSARIELRGLTSRMDRYLGESYSPECRADLGDARCTVDIEALTQLATVTARVSDSAFTMSVPVTQPARRYALGTLVWETGNNVGYPMEILQDAVPGTVRSILLTLPMAQTVQVGDTARLYPGCDKMLSTCVGVFDNAVNFRGEPATALSEQIGGYTFPSG